MSAGQVHFQRYKVGTLSSEEPHTYLNMYNVRTITFEVTLGPFSLAHHPQVERLEVNGERERRPWEVLQLPPPTPQIILMLRNQNLHSILQRFKRAPSFSGTGGTCQVDE